LVLTGAGLVYVGRMESKAYFEKLINLDKPPVGVVIEGAQAPREVTVEEARAMLPGLSLAMPPEEEDEEMGGKRDLETGSCPSGKGGAGGQD